MHNLRKSVSMVMAGLLAAGVVAVNVQAGQGSPRGPAPFTDFDLDGSGFIDEDEFNKVRSERMAARAAEGKPMRGAASAPAFADLDTDGDGQLSPEELSAGQKAHMKEMQASGHGKGMRNGSGPGKGMKGKMPQFADFDLNADGKIVESEFNQAHARVMSEMAARGGQMKHADDAPGFAGIDTDHDGEISEAEFSAHQAEHHQKHQGQADQD